MHHEPGCFMVHFGVLWGSIPTQNETKWQTLIGIGNSHASWIVQVGISGSGRMTSASVRNAKLTENLQMNPTLFGFGKYWIWDIHAIFFQSWSIPPSHQENAL